MKLFRLLMLIMVTASFALISGTVQAAGEDDPYTITSVPREMSYQGILKDSGGDPVPDSVYSVTFRIFNVASGGTSLWNETLPCTTTAGYFNALFSNVNLPFDEDYWLELEVASEILSPRQKLSMVGYAAVADTADYAQRVATIDGATGGTISGNVSIQSNLSVAGNISATGKATIGPGHTNTGTYAFVAGNNNTVNNTAATVGGGQGNTAGLQATVGGGINNQATDQYCTVAGGGGNAAITFGSTVGGGFGNDAGWGTRPYATISGGHENEATGSYATVPGGYLNTADGEYSFAAGYRAKATHQGSFVWADSYNANFTSSGSNEFNVRASGGTRIFSNTSLTAGVRLWPGASSWSSVSDSTLKRNIRPVDGSEILEKLSRLPISRWSYKAQDPSIEHIGPMAQDFYAAFGVGEDDGYIATIDADGVALAGLKELIQIVNELKEENEQLKTEIDELRQMIR